MTNFTKRFKKHKHIKNKTIKRGGNKVNENINNINSYEKPKREGIMDKFGKQISGVATSVKNFALDNGLKVFGLQRIQPESSNESNESNESVDEKEPSLMTDITKIADKTGTTVLNNINEVLDSDTVQNTTEQAIEDTAQILKKGAEKINESLNDPEVKDELEQSIKNLGELGSVAVEASKEPVKKAVDIAVESGQKVTSAALAGAVRVGTDVLAAVPVVGAVIDAGKAINDGSKAVSAMVEAGSEVAEAASDAIIETTENFEEGIKDLKDKQKMAEQISRRTSNSIKEFETPKMIPQSVGGYKTRRRLLKRKVKSKRVRFAI